MNTAAAPTLTDDDPRSEANIERRKAGRLAERDEQGRLLPGSVLERAGRPAGHTVQFMARQYTSEAITCLAGVMEDERAPPAARCTAAMALLDRGWGKSPISIDLSARTNFADFLRDVGLSAQWEHDHVAEVEVVE
jgi:hypothetical protein